MKHYFSITAMLHPSSLTPSQKTALLSSLAKEVERLQKEIPNLNPSPSWLTLVRYEQRVERIARTLTQHFSQKNTNPQDPRLEKKLVLFHRILFYLQKLRTHKRSEYAAHVKKGLEDFKKIFILEPSLLTQETRKKDQRSLPLGGCLA